MTRVLAILAVAMICAPALAAEQAGASYASDLSRVYAATQFVQARKEGCDTAEPETRKANDAAYNVWRKQHQGLLDELEKRFLAMIRGASTDQKDYSKNVGKYAGEALQNLEELKKIFLAQPAQEVSRQCHGFPEYLKSGEADLRKRYAAELKAIRKRKL